MQLKAVVKEALGVFWEFGHALFWCALGVVLLSFLALGFLSVWGLSGKEALELYTPLLLGLFSIGITLYLFQRNVREGRDRAKKERDQAVKPILIMRQADIYTGSSAVVQKECYVSAPTPSKTYEIMLENVGVGIALEADIFFRCCDGSFYRVAYPVTQIKVDEKLKLIIKASLPEMLDGIMVRYSDVYGNKFLLDAGYNNAAPYLSDAIYYNEHRDYVGKDKEYLADILRSPFQSKENYNKYREFLEELESDQSE